MPDILADGTFGRDDGIECYECGGKTFLSFDQGRGLQSYDCADEKCAAVTTVQFEYDDDDDHDDDDFDYVDFDLYDGVTFGSPDE
jgi:hypothetical protein